MDMCNSEIISYSISQKPSAESIMNALNKAIEITSDCKYCRTIHSDQGWAYQMKSYVYMFKLIKFFKVYYAKVTVMIIRLWRTFFKLRNKKCITVMFTTVMIK